MAKCFYCGKKSFRGVDWPIHPKDGIGTCCKEWWQSRVAEVGLTKATGDIKLDRQVRKVFLRLGLIGEKASPEEIVEIGKTMAKAVREKPAVVDCAVWYFGKKVCKVKRDCEKCLIEVCVSRY